MKTMKHITKLSLILVFILAHILCFSNEYRALTKKNSQETNNIYFENVNQGSLLYIKDSDGLILYSEVIGENGIYSKEFILTNLPNADYYFELDKEDKIEITPFIVKGNRVEFETEKVYEIAKPKVSIDDNHLYISKIAMNMQSIKIEVYSEDYDLTFSERIKNTQSMNRIYDFTNFKKGNYIILVKSDGRVFENRINIGSAI